MRKRFIEYLTDGITQVVFDSVISIVIALLVGVLTNLGLEDIGSNAKLVVSVLVLVSVYIIVMIIEIYGIRRYKFVFEKMHCVFSYDGQKARVKQTILFRPNRFCADKMYFEKTWYDDHFKVESSNGYEVDVIAKEGNTTKYYLIFPKKIYWWQRGKAIILFEGDNSQNVMMNYYDYKINCPIKKLYIDIVIPSKLCKNKLDLIVYENNEDNAPRKTVEFFETYHWEVKKYRINDHCMARWTWKKKSKKKA